MSSSAKYHPAEPPDSPDSDSDLELDLHELDPQTISSSTTSRGFRSIHNSSQQQRSQPRIALRNLRMGSLRRTSNQSREYGKLGLNRNTDIEGATVLAGEGRNSFRNADGSPNADDAIPLLDEHGPPLRRSFDTDRLTGFNSRLRLFNLISSVRPPLKKKCVEEEQEDNDPSASRFVAVGSHQTTRFPPNIVSNAKYTAWSFLPITLYNEFSFFLNMYFLLVALSQAIPALRIGYLSTYVAPLAFVLIITMGKEAYDDIERRRRDNEANSEEYTVLQFEEPGSGRHTNRTIRKLKSSAVKRKGRKQDVRERGRLSDIQEEHTEEEGLRAPSSYFREVPRKSKDLKVGDVLKLSKGERVPADVIIVKCIAAETESSQSHAEETVASGPLLVDHVTDSEDASNSQKSAKMNADMRPSGSVGETFIRTDQLDGETDWKLRLASPLTQNTATNEFVHLRITGGKPDKKVNEFFGTVELLSREAALGLQESVAESTQSAPLSIDNTAWANTVIASHGTTLAVILYTGAQTRSALSTAPSRSKVGLLEYEINSLTKILCFLTLALSVVLVALEGFNSEGNTWYVKIMRFLVLFSTIVPISLRVNLDLGKSAYSWFIHRDQGIPGAVVRTSTIPEDLGRIEYLLSDKTGTLTQNEMEMKKIHVGTVSYANDAMDEVASYIKHAFNVDRSTTSLVMPSSAFTLSSMIGGTRTRREIGSRVRDVVLALALCHNVTPTEEEEDGKIVTSYQASSPDEIAIVKWTESVGLRLTYRDRKGMILESKSGQIVVQVRILDIFPFTSEGKRMGIIVHFYSHPSKAAVPDLTEGEIWFYQKGADAVMSSIVAANDWLEEETANMAREGLRTLVVGRKRLTHDQYQEFNSQYKAASLAISGRDAGMQQVVSQYLEYNLELLGVTGVEDKLQRDVKPSLELLRNAGIKIWMLTGDKVETARCVAVSSRLVARGQYIHTVSKQKKKEKIQEHLDFLRSKPDSCLLIDGESLALFLTHFQRDFIGVAVLLPTVVACRCSPTQKADIAKLIKEYTKKRVCCIGDGGNDVSMIQAADVGVGIVGKEGRQASLAADFSIEHFFHLTKLLVWHGRNSYKRSAKLAQFVIHRGLIIAVCQTMYSIAIRFEPEGLFKDWLLVGYATIYTAMPVLSLVLDKDVDENLATLYPELYKELTEGRSLSYRTFFVWVFVSIYQGCIIQGLSQLLTDIEGKRMITVSYTVLILNELLMVGVEITTWHPIMIASIVGTFVLYMGSIPFLGEYFDLAFVISL